MKSAPSPLTAPVVEQSASTIGRPSKFTPEMQDKLLSALRAGNYRSVAARYAGISDTTLHRYLARGKDPTADPIYRDFCAAVEKAEADAEVADLGLIRRAAAGGAWQAAAWIRERRNPERWGRRERTQVELSGVDGAPVQVEGSARQLDPAIMAALAETLAQRAAEPDDVVDAEVVPSAGELEPG